MTVFRALVAITTITLLAVLLSTAEKNLCTIAAYRGWKALWKLRIAIERIYYLRSGYGRILYVGQTVDEDRRWQQHQTDGRKVGTRKSDWASLLSKQHCSVVRYCWTHNQVMRVERRRTLSIYLWFAMLNFCEISHYQISNVSNTPRDPRKKPKPWEWAIAAVFLPFYMAEGWLDPKAQWSVPVSWEDLQE